MFERRVVVLLLIVLAGCGAIVVRAAQVTLGQRGQWRAFLDNEMSRSAPVQTTRGRILDRHGEVLAEDEPCIDARVAFPALLDPPPERWVNAVTRQRLLADASFERGDRAAWDAEEARVRADHAALWGTLAAVAGVPEAEVQDRRREVVADVLGRRAHLTDRRHRRAVAAWQAAGPPAWWRRWLLGEDGARPDRADFDEAIGEEHQAHILLRDLTQARQNALAKRIDRLPGLELRPGMRRVYPHGPAAAHAVGRLARVTAGEVRGDPQAGDPLRRYRPDDLAGRRGVEALAERALRGTRGLDFTTLTADGGADSARQDPLPGADVTTTLDITLQERVAAAFGAVESPHVVEWKEYGGGVVAPAAYESKPMHGAAVVIDVPTGQVLALVSAPSFDPNTFDADYTALIGDRINTPLLNRATQVPREIGSTMKVITGIGAMSDGFLEPGETIHCDGFLHDDGRRLRYARCWVNSYFGWAGHTHDGGPLAHPTNDLTLADALQRSCNVFFETLGDRMGLDGLEAWQRAFGFGERTGIGLEEHAGRSSGDFTSRNRGDYESEAWFNAIGQGQVAATPLQNANAVAAVARGGVWLAPTLLPGREQARREIPISPAAARVSREGMRRVANTPAGTGYTSFTVPLRERGVRVEVAGKTGSATASDLTYTDGNGDRVYVPFAPTVLPGDDAGTVAAKLAASSPAPWYHPQVGPDGPKLGRDNRPEPQSHAWYVGYAPADEPRIAFAVIVDYGGSGGRSAGGVAREVISACVDLGYLDNPPETVAQR